MCTEFRVLAIINIPTLVIISFKNIIWVCNTNFNKKKIKIILNNQVKSGSIQQTAMWLVNTLASFIDILLDCDYH